MKKTPPLYVYGTGTCAAATADGMPVNLKEGEVWDAKDAFVIARPEFFADEPPGPWFPRRSVAAPDV